MCPGHDAVPDVLKAQYLLCWTISVVGGVSVFDYLWVSVLSGMIVTSALIIWKGLMCFTGSESPVVVVLSGSMEPGFRRVWFVLFQ